MSFCFEAFRAPILSPSTRSKSLSRRPQKTVTTARAWDLMLLGDVFIERLELGYKLKFNWMDRNVTRGLIDALDQTGDSVSSIFGGHGTLLPTGITAKSLGYMAFMQKKVFEPALEAIAKEQKRLLLDPGKMLDMDPLMKRAYFSYILEKDRGIRSDFNSEP
jgi:hypothetical protein